ncbi:mechanosensitive ion channel family protein [[Scytonema hofmanni] UTEX B 1581]|nr:mechanosensitive ion channel family protein [[Scytonema hofmanni] UTEX B 1581]
MNNFSNFQNIIAEVPQYLRSIPLPSPWKTLVINAIVILVSYIFIFYILRIWFRRFRSDAAIMTLNVSKIPALIISILLSLKLFLVSLGTSTFLTTVQKSFSAIIIITLTFWLVSFLTEVVVYYLVEFAEKSEAQWDDVLVPLLQNVLPVIVYLTGGLLSLQAFGLDLTGLWVAVGGAAFILGFALKDILGNFFAGVVLLIDSPFRFGDVVTLEDGKPAIIKKVGLRLTTLYVIDQHCDLYVPNNSIQSQSILNLSRPTAHYYYTLSFPVKSDADPARVIELMQSVILAHPDTLGNVDRKLKMLNEYFGMSEEPTKALQKREAGQLRLLAEKQVNALLAKVEQAFDDLSDKISRMEDGGLDKEEIRNLQRVFMDICQMIGMEVLSDRLVRSKRVWLEESPEAVAAEGALIGFIRCWYKSWLKDPDLLHEDRIQLPKYWEQKINLLKIKMNKLFVKVSKTSSDDTRLDDAMSSLRMWMQENFKTTRNEWQEPKIWVSEIQQSERNFSVKFYVDDITLEHCERGVRIKSEVNRELTWQLRRSYLSI